MSGRIDKAWTVLDSIESGEHDRCVDLFRRPDGTFGFEEFRRDVEDAGAWTPVHYYSGTAYRTREAAFEAAARAVGWLGEAPARERPRQGGIPRQTRRDPETSA